MIDSRVPLHLRGDFEVGIGSGPDCDVVLAGLDPVHAKIRRTGDRLFFKTLKADRRTSVNQKIISGNRWIEITRFDEIMIAGTVLSISPKFFLGRDRVGLDTTPLRYVLPGRPKRVLCDGPYLRARPGTFTAILGPTGSGKTLFLSLLNGYLAPTSGRVVIADNFDPHRDHRILRDFVGYVPQDDILIPELTVRQSLKYRLELKFPDMAAYTRNRLIYDTCHQLGLNGERADKFLDTIIGSPDLRRRGLSGGERKRANIAHELITKPLILIVDEPTSGLSSADADQIAGLLRRLATEDSLSVIASVHQPSVRVFEQFDDLMVLGFGGRLAYYGSASESVDFFQKATGKPSDGPNPAEWILEQVVNPGVGAQIGTAFERHRAHSPNISLPLQESGTEVSPAIPPQRAKAGGLPAWLCQWITLTLRSLAVLRTDRTSLMLNLLQAPLMALLILGAFQGVDKDKEKSDRISKTIHFFRQEIQPYMDRNDTITTPEAKFEEAAERSKTDAKYYGPGAAQRRGAIYFTLVAASIWFGMLGACREIVGEQHILKREIRTCTNLMPFLGSKALVQLLLTGILTAILAFMVNLTVLRLEALYAARLWAILWLVAAASASLGLLVSCVAPTYRAALTAVPILMIPQLLFGGILRPPVDIAREFAWPQRISAITIQYWGFQAALEIVSPVERKGLRENFSDDWENMPYQRYEAKVVGFQEKTLSGVFFPAAWSSWIFRPFFPLLAALLFFLLSGYVALRLKFL